MRQFLCAWDGGGTKTEVILEGTDREVRRFGPLNLNGNSREQVRDTVAHSLQFMKDQSGGLDHIAALVIGTAGTSNTDMTAFLTDLVREYGFSGPMTIVGDHETAMEGAIRGSGCVLVSGTGSVCNGRNLETGKTARSGGFGYLIDDEGSGYAIARDILRAVVRMEDGRGPHTCFRQMVFDELGLKSIQELITWLYAPGNGKQSIAHLGRLLPEGLRTGDACAHEIAENAAQELSEMCINTWKHLHLTRGETALVGSVVEGTSLIRTSLEAKLLAAFPDMQIHNALAGPAEGALIMARHLAEREGV